MILTYIAAGSNLGDRESYLQQALARLSGTEIRFIAGSKNYETEPVGGPPQGKYLNAVWKVETTLSAKDLLNKLFEIEKTLGRVRSERNAPRTIDLDILFYGNAVIEEPGLTVPHPRLQEREFVLRPMMDLDPGMVHPRLKKTIQQLWQEFHEANRRS
jgi:2-amino-4-hydroxy-6-hydroxymethyldihydropteridine diphosphokinase